MFAEGGLVPLSGRGLSQKKTLPRPLYTEATLLAAMDMDESVIESFYVAGGIGSGINMRNAVRIGMFPNVPLELFHYIGNSSLAGAYTMALSDEANDRVEQVARNMTYMELSTHPGYMDAFVAACFLPHTDAARFASAE